MSEQLTRRRIRVQNGGKYPRGTSHPKEGRVVGKGRMRKRNQK